MRYDLQCQCGKGIRVLRGDLAEIPCADCGRNVPVTAALRAGLPAEYRPLGAWASATETQGRFARLWKDSPVKVVCWSLAAGLALIPVFVKPDPNHVSQRAADRPVSPEERLAEHWTRIAGSQSPAVYRAFADENPEAGLRADIVDKIWEVVRASDNPADAEWFERFARTGSRSQEAYERRLALERSQGLARAKGSKDLAVWTAFMDKARYDSVPAEVDEALWADVSALDTAEAYDEYQRLTRYAGAHEPDIQAARDRLGAAARVRQDQEDLARVKGAGTLRDWEEFLGRYNYAMPPPEVDEALWAAVAAIGTRDAYNLYEYRVPTGAHREECLARKAKAEAVERARQEEEARQKTAREMQAKLEALRAAPSRSGAQQFLSLYPAAEAASEVREILFAELEKGSPGANAPSVALLRRMVAGSRREVTVAVTGFTNQDTGNQAFYTLTNRLLPLGITPKKVDGAEGDFCIVGAESKDTTMVYGNRKLGEFSVAPHPEKISVTISARPPGAPQAEWSTSFTAASPETVKYTVPEYGIDMGPSESDVHSSTLSALSEAMLSLLEYK